MKSQMGAELNQGFRKSCDSGLLQRGWGWGSQNLPTALWWEEGCSWGALSRGSSEDPQPALPQGSGHVVRAVIHGCYFHEVICSLLPAGAGGGGGGRVGWDRLVLPSRPPSLSLAGKRREGGKEGRQEGGGSISATI